MSRRIQRIASVTLLGFRGFIKECHLDTNADIVILAGPNGHGKTSFLEGVVLALTGHHTCEDPGTLFSYDQPELNVRLDVQDEDGILGTLAVKGLREVGPAPRGTAKPFTRTASWKGSNAELSSVYGRATGAPEDEPELDARVCAFFQDQVWAQFDHAARGRTLRDVFEPVPPRWQMAVEDQYKGLRRALQDLANKISFYGSDAYPWKEREAIDKEFSEYAETLRSVYRPLAGRRGWPAWPAAFDGSLAWTLAEMRSEDDERGRRRFLERLEATLQEEIRKDRESLPRERGRLESVERRLDEIRIQLASIQDAFPNLDDEASWFSGRPGLLEILQSIEENLTRWRREATIAATTYPELRAVQMEVEAVQVNVATRRHDELQLWIGPRRAAQTERSALRAEEGRLLEERESLLGTSPLEMLKPQLAALRMENTLSRWTRQQELAAYDARREGRASAARYLEDKRAQGEALLDAYEAATSARTELRLPLEKRMNTVLRRFALTEGLYPVHLDSVSLRRSGDNGEHRAVAIVADDKRPLAALSTGQRSQFAIALLIAQNDVIRASPGVGLPHHVMLLDDASSSYDLSNLTREAITWRKLAYDPDRTRRRQIFISSHHDDLTNHLLDLLSPPGKSGDGFQPSLRVFQFKDWRRESGPVIEKYRVAPPRTGEDQIREDLARNLRRGPP